MTRRLDRVLSKVRSGEPIVREESLYKKQIAAVTKASKKTNFGALDMASRSRIVVVAMDHRVESANALTWALDHEIRRNDKLVVVHCQPVVPSYGGTTSFGYVNPEIASDIKTVNAYNTNKIIETALEICKERSLLRPQFEIGKGDSRKVICEAVKKYQADVLVIGKGSHGDSKFRIFSSNVTDHCTRNAGCTVRIV